ncbi:hypothetical protein BH11GEM1_BH11GEM1_24070 [soil metagenome]
MSDITQSASGAAQLAEATEAALWRRLSAIIDHLADGIVVVDPRGSIRFANPAAGRLFNRSPEALVGTPLGTPLVAGETTEMEIVRRGGGEVVHAELRVVATEWAGENAELVSLRDITDRKFAQERARQLTHEREARLHAEAASRTKSDFLAIMSHELRTPLNAILGYAELIELGISTDGGSSVPVQAGRIRSSARHLLALVNDILDLAKVEAGRLTVDNALANVAEAVESALILVNPQAAARNLHVVVPLGVDRIPAYLGDAERVRQILVNLLSNAVKSTEAGGTITIDTSVMKAPDIAAGLEPRAAYVRISVRDTGSGIVAEKLAEIFEPFVQAESGPTRTREGSGLGLTIGRKLARAMGGDVTVESTMGTGSTFHLWLPADPSLDGPAPVATGETPQVEGGIRHTGRVLHRPRESRGLGVVAHSMLANLGHLVKAVVERIRCDPLLRTATGLRTSQVTDHLPTLLSDVAGALVVVEESAGETSALLADAMEIQRLVAERHGTQRARLGWTEASLRREFMIIREEVERVVRDAVPADGPLEPIDAVATVNRFLDQSEYIAVRVLEKELAT